MPSSQFKSLKSQGTVAVGVTAAVKTERGFKEEKTMQDSWGRASSEGIGSKVILVGKLTQVLVFPGSFGLSSLGPIFQLLMLMCFTIAFPTS